MAPPLTQDESGESTPELPATGQSVSVKDPDQRWNIGFPVAVILLSHIIVDTYSVMVPTLLGVVEAHFQMLEASSALLLGLGSICSGLAQPTFAWLSDKFNSRIFGSLGLLIGGLAICSLGFLPGSAVLFPVYALGMIGIGMYHPIAASTIGSLAGDRRSLAISWFFVAGMAGMTIGSLSGPWLTTRGGSLQNLAWLIVPGLVFVALLQYAIGSIEHNPSKKSSGTGSAPAKSFRDYHLPSIVVLFFTSALKFVVNMAFIYLLLRWLQHHVALGNPDWSREQVADFAAANNGAQMAAMYVGMAVGGLSAGWLIPKGRERVPLIVLPLLFAPTIMALCLLTPGVIALGVCFLAGCGFACLVPVTISVGQRLMPFHTSLASGLMLGGAWAVASTGPSLAQFLVSSFGLTTALIATGCILALSGIVAIGLNEKVIQDS